MNYQKLITKSFNYRIKKQEVTSKMITKCLQKCYIDAAFSTFPYIVSNYNSTKALDKTNSGNCVGLALFVKQCLKEIYNVNSFLIPATIPNKYKHDGFLEISHVALAIPIDKENIYIADPAFYFLAPILINKKKKTNKPIICIDIYNDKPDLIFSNNYQLKKKIFYNKYQSFPKNTFICEAFVEGDQDDTWNYFLREVINPDHSISTFFINTRKKPFITTTELRPDGSCRKFVDLRVLNDKDIMVYIRNKLFYNGAINELSLNEINTLNNLLYNFLGNDIRYFLNYSPKKKYTFKLLPCKKSKS